MEEMDPYQITWFIGGIFVGINYKIMEQKVFKFRVPLDWHLDATPKIIQDKMQIIQSVLLCMEDVDSLVLPAFHEVKWENDANTIYFRFTVNLKG